MPPEQNTQVQYSGDEFVSSGSTTSLGKPDLPDRLVSWGIAPDRQMAQYILIGVIVVCSSIGLYFAFFSGSSGPPAGVPVPGGAPGAIPQSY